MAWAEPVRPGYVSGRPFAAALFVVGLVAALASVSLRPAPDPALVAYEPASLAHGRYVGLRGLDGRAFVPDGWARFRDPDELSSRFGLSFTVATDTSPLARMLLQTPGSITKRALDPRDLDGDDAFVQVVAVHVPPGPRGEPSIPDMPGRLTLKSLSAGGSWMGEPAYSFNGEIRGSVNVGVWAWTGPFASDETKRELVAIVESLQISVRG